MSMHLGAKEFLALPGPIFDVRSPIEFSHARIPGAVNLPLFENEERAAVGTLYKQSGKQAALALGLQCVGPKLSCFLEKAACHAKEGMAKIHCSRGGMRSSSMAWLFELSGLSVATLQGGYKAFRHWCLDQFYFPFHLIIVGGFTGTGKTEILIALKDLGEQILDLEALAQHRGSSFGMIGIEKAQPSTEQFENEIAVALSEFDPMRPIWMEDESRLIGTCHIPAKLFDQMRTASLIVIETALSERIERLEAQYKYASQKELSTAILRISKQLGGQCTQEVLQLLSQQQLRKAISIVLSYYDAAYRYALTKRSKPCATLSDNSLSPSEWAKLLQRESKNFIPDKKYEKS